jgi:hypothetical protein
MGKNPPYKDIRHNIHVHAVACRMYETSEVLHEKNVYAPLQVDYIRVSNANNNFLPMHHK